jgi:NAD(P)-dependent dehydrogenase (short-subunit alcohol dehydrogenase family)
MQSPQILITGAGSGIGRALAVHAASQGFQVLGIGRRREPLRETQAQNPKHIQILAADIAKAEDRTQITRAFSSNSLRFLVHNAAVLQPVASFADIKPEEWQTHMDINLNAPLYLTQALLPYFANPARILSVSSGAAHKSYAGWTAYCTAKAALAMLTECMDTELKARGIRAGNAAPGVVDTAMQDQVRESDPQAFPNLQRFLDLKRDDALTKPETTAAFFWRLLTQEDEESFSQTQWDIRTHG